jgi:hypothetical protein
MDDFWGVTVVLALVLVGVACAVARAMAYFRRNIAVDHGRVLLSEALPSLKTGDLVFFVSHAHGFSNSLFTLDLYSHAAVVVEAGDGSLALSESTIDPTTPLSRQKGEAVRTAQLNPLLPRLEAYRGALFLSQLEEPLDPAARRRLEAAAAEEAPYPSFWQMAAGLLGLPTHRSARHCMQHVAWLLDRAGVAPAFSDKRRPLAASGLLASSRAVTTLPGKPLTRGGRYGPVRALYPDTAALLAARSR